MDKLLEKIRQYEVAGENVRNAAWVAFVDSKVDVSVELARELTDRLNLAEIDGAKAERAIIKAMAITVARQEQLIK